MRARTEDASAARWAIAALAAMVMGGAPGPLAAQDPTSAPVPGPVWLRAWSPLQWTAELPRTLPSAEPSLPDPALYGIARVGQFWTAGNPGALAFELHDNLSAYRAIGRRDDGTYRRPLDPGRATTSGLALLGWGPFAEHAAAIGRVRVAHVTLDRELSDYDLGYLGSPYVVMDTAGSQLGRTDASLEGAAGWRGGALGLGVALGYRAQQTRTSAAPVPRILSAADPSAALGVEWSVAPALRIGVLGRWRAHAERVLLYSVAAASRVYRLQGYYEARPQDVASGWYQMRMDRRGYALNLSLGGELHGATWAAFLERGTEEERQQVPGRNDAPADTWKPRAWTSGAAVQRAIPALRAEVVVSGRYTTLWGEARRADLPDTVTFTGYERVLDGAVDVGMDVTPTVRLAARFTSRYEIRVRTDQIALLHTDLKAWTTGIGIAAVVRPVPSLSLSAGGAVAKYGAGGAIPDPRVQGVAYRTCVAPELSLEASDANAWAASASVAWSVLPGGASLWGRVALSGLRPSAATQLPLAPTGTRTGWGVEFGIVVGR